MTSVAANSCRDSTTRWSTAGSSSSSVPSPAVAASAFARREGDAVQSLLQLGDDDADTRLWHADQLQRTGQDEAALAECDRILTSRPEHLSARYHRARLLSFLGRSQEAEAESAAVVDDRPVRSS